MSTTAPVQAANSAILALTAINLALESQIKQLELERGKTRAEFEKAMQEAQTLIKNLGTELAQLKNSQIMQRAELQALQERNRKLEEIVRYIFSKQGRTDKAWYWVDPNYQGIDKVATTSLVLSAKDGARKRYLELTPPEKAYVDKAYQKARNEGNLPGLACQCSRSPGSWYDCRNRFDDDFHDRCYDPTPPRFYHQVPVDSPLLKKFGGLLDEILGSRDTWAPTQAGLPQDED